MGETFTERWGAWTIKVSMFCLGVWNYQASSGNFLNTGTVSAANRTRAVGMVKEKLGGAPVDCIRVRST
jgi:hypothetical protein